MTARVETEQIPYRLLYGGRRRSAMAFLDELESRGTSVTIYPEDETGPIPIAPAIEALGPGSAVYACGPPSLLNATRELCASLQVTYRSEAFQAPATADPETDTAFDVILEHEGTVHRIPPGRSILEVLEEDGVTVIASCREGTCGTCETPVLEGDVDHRDAVLTEDERAANDIMMICVSRCRSATLRLDL